MPRRASSVLGTGSRYLLTVLLGTTLSMAIAYGAVRALTKGMEFAPDADSAAVRQGWDLRAATNELTRLTNEFTEAVPAPGSPLTPQARTWLRGDYPREMEALQKALSTEAMLNTAAARDLLNACGRLRALALHPDDANLRGAVTAEIHNALDGVDRHLREAGLAGHIALPITPLR